MYTFLLSISSIFYAKSLLRFLSYIQLGLSNDVYADCVYKKCVLHFNICFSFGASSGMGDFISQVSGKILQEYQQIALVRQL